MHLDCVWSVDLNQGSLTEASKKTKETKEQCLGNKGCSHVFDLDEGFNIVDPSSMQDMCQI